MKSQRTRLSDVARPVQMRKSISTEPCIGRQPVEHFQPIHGHPSVIIGCNPRFVEALGTVETGSCSQNPQYVSLRDALTIFSPLSLPKTSGKTSETGGSGGKGTQTFENESISWAPKVVRRRRAPVGHSKYKFRFISEDIELVGILKILSRVNFETVIICIRGCRELCVKMRVLPESQTLLLVLEKAKVPQNLLNA
jgi:hypothetical protein